MSSLRRRAPLSCWPRTSEPNGEDCLCGVLHTATSSTRRAESPLSCLPRTSEAEMKEKTVRSERCLCGVLHKDSRTRRAEFERARVFVFAGVATASAAVAEHLPQAAPENPQPSKAFKASAFSDLGISGSVKASVRQYAIKSSEVISSQQQPPLSPKSGPPTATISNH